MMVCVTLLTTRPGPPGVPAAVRATRPGWRDPRLWVGVAIVAASVVLGARLVGGADDTVPVWTVRADLGAGDTVAGDDVVARRVRFTSSADADRYLSARSPLPSGARLSRDVGAGELLPRSALAVGADTALTQVTLQFQGAGVPTGLQQGDHVDVYVTSVKAAQPSAVRPTTVKPGSADDLGAVKALTAVLVLDVGRSAQSLAGGGGELVTVGVPAGTDLTRVVQAAKTDNLFLADAG